MNLTLLFDGNHFLYRALGVAGVAKDAEHHCKLDFRADPAGDRAILLRKMCDMFAAEVSRFRNARVDQVVYCVDSLSWRKVVFPDEAYKGNRVKDESTDWGQIMAAYAEFQQALASVGVVVSKSPGAEGDDLLFYWSQSLNHWQARSVVIVSGDNDLLQLVGKDQATGAFTVVYNKAQGRLSTFHGFADWAKLQGQAVPDIFEEVTSGDWSTLAADIHADVVEVDPNRYLFAKILTGDVGDNVRSVFQRRKQTKGGEKTYRFTDRMASEALVRYERDNMFFGQHHMFDDVQIDRLASIVREVVKAEDGEATLEEIASRWKTNRDLVCLHARCIPDNVMAGMAADYELGYSKSTGRFTGEDVARECPTLQAQAVSVPAPAPGTQQGGFNKEAWNDLRS